MKIVFLGTPKFAQVILEKIQQNFPVSLVVTQPDKPVGRKQRLTPTPVKLFAQRKKIPLLTSTSIIYIMEVLKKLKPEVIVVAAYGPPFLTKEILKLPKYHCLNIHPSLLPKYRGASPIQFALLNGDKETGVTIFKMTEKIDKGDILCQKELTILKEDSSETLAEKLASFGAELIIKLLGELKRYGRVHSQFAQDHSQATYARRLKREDGFIPFASLKKVLCGKELEFSEFPPFIQEQIKKNNLSIEQFNREAMHNFIRGLYPWPTAWTILPNNKRLKLLKSYFKNGQFYLAQIQLEGRKPSSDSEFLKRLL